MECSGLYRKWSPALWYQLSTLIVEESPFRSMLGTWLLRYLLNVKIPLTMWYESNCAKELLTIIVKVCDWNLKGSRDMAHYWCELSHPYMGSVVTVFPIPARRGFFSVFELPLRPWQTRTHCCRHKCFPVCPRAQHLLRTHKKCFWFCSETYCVRNEYFPVCAAQEKSWAKCVRNNVSSFASTFTVDITK